MKQRETILASGVSSEPPIHTQATARPWSATPYQRYGDGFRIGNHNEMAAMVPGYQDHPHIIANAALIVKAVNRDHHFDALVKLVQEILTDELCNNGAPPGVGWFDRAEKLIAALAGAK